MDLSIDSGFTYTEHRSIDSLTVDVAPENIAEMTNLIENAEPSVKHIMQLETIDDKWWFNHWFVVIMASIVP
jgi:hypothetical protein